MNPGKLFNGAWSLQLEVTSEGKPPIKYEYPPTSEITIGRAPGVQVQIDDPDVEPHHCSLHAKGGTLVAVSHQGRPRLGAGWLTNHHRSVYVGTGPAELTVGDTQLTARLAVTERPSPSRASNSSEAPTFYGAPLPDALRRAADDSEARTEYYEDPSRIRASNVPPPARRQTPPPSYVPSHPPRPSPPPPPLPSRTPPSFSHVALRHDENREATSKRTTRPPSGGRHAELPVELIKAACLLGAILVVGLLILAALTAHDVRSMKAGVRCVTGAR